MYSLLILFTCNNDIFLFTALLSHKINFFGADEQRSHPSASKHTL